MSIAYGFAALMYLLHEHKYMTTKTESVHPRIPPVLPQPGKPSEATGQLERNPQWEARLEGRTGNGHPRRAVHARQQDHLADGEEAGALGWHWL